MASLMALKHCSSDSTCDRMMNLSKPRVTFEFEVEKVIGISPDGRYQVQWAPAWVSKFHLVGCEHLIQEFMKEQVEQEKGLENEKQTKAEPENQFESQDDARKCETTGATKVNSECDNTSKPLSMGITVKDETIDTNDNSFASINMKSEESSKEFMNLMDGLLGCSSTKEEPRTSKPSTENIEEYDHPSKSCEISHTSGDDTAQTFTTLDASHSGDLIVPVSSEKDTGISLALVRSSASRETSPHSEGIQRKNDAGFPRERKQLTQAKKVRMPLRNRKTSVRKEVDPQPHTFSHGTKSLITCDVCNKIFSRPSALKYHYRSHTNERPYTCRHCGKSFRRPDHWKDHERIHSGEKPYCCSNCEKSFSSSSGLASHRRCHSH